AAALRKRPPIAEGAPAPELSAVNERSRPVKLAGLPRKPVVIVFGSWSCPSFRQRLPQLERLAATYQKRVHFLVIYTREAHAVGEWEVERNRDEQIQIAQPADLAGRIERATAATSPVLKAFELAIDDMSDATVRAYGLFPNGAVVLKPDRT